jgi:hypothetical protein
MRIEVMLSASRNRVVTSSTVGKDENSKGFLMNRPVIRIRIDEVIDKDSNMSSTRLGIGMIRMTMMPMTPVAITTSPRFSQP